MFSSNEIGNTRKRDAIGAEKTPRPVAADYVLNQLEALASRMEGLAVQVDIRLSPIAGSCKNEAAGTVPPEVRKTLPPLFAAMEHSIDRADRCIDQINMILDSLEI